MIKGVLNMKKSIKQNIIVLIAVSAMALSACAKSDTSTPDSSKTETTDTANDTTNDTAAVDEAEKAYLISILDDIRDNMEVGTAGSSLKAVPYGAKLLDWSLDPTMDAKAVKDVVTEWLGEQDSDKLAEINEQLMLAVSTAQALTGESGKELMESAGFESENYPWSDAKTDIISEALNAVGAEGAQERPVSE